MSYQMPQRTTKSHTSLSSASDAIFRSVMGDIRNPLVIDVSRSGTQYPPEFLPTAPFDVVHKKLSPHVEQLVAPAWKAGATILMAQFPPTFVDPNRPIDDIDPDIFEGAWPSPLNPQQASQQTGSGLIHTLTSNYAPLYSKKISVNDIRNRIDNYYRPYHDTLSDLLAGKRDVIGCAFQLSCHSMSSVGPRDGIKRPDVCLGDLNGATASPLYRDAVSAVFRHTGFEVALNKPFKGNELLRRHAAPLSGIYSIQVEVRRDLYLDEGTRELTDGLQVLQKCFSEIAALAPGLAAEHKAL